jgi:predicted DNA-binding transcriptional regulator AlpA
MRRKHNKGLGRHVHQLNRLHEFGTVPIINPDFLYRQTILPAFLGLGLSQIKAKIKSGEFPKPVKLSEHGRAIGYYGSQLLEIKAKRIAQATAA